MTDPRTGVRIRMYRQGHGDCFLLSFYPRDLREDDRLFHVLIDYGKKSGSEILADDGAGGTSEVTMEEVWTDIHATTGGVIDLAVVTHEHEDHVSGFPSIDDLEHADHPFHDIEIKTLWLAWTEDGTDAEANQIREDYNDQLVTLAAAAAHRRALGADGETDAMIADLLELETGMRQPDAFLAGIGAQGPGDAFAASKPAGYTYKVRLAGLRRVVGEANIVFLDPAAGAAKALSPDLGVKVYPLGPPRDIGLLKSLDPLSAEEFKLGAKPTSAAGHGLFRAFSGHAGNKGTGGSPFATKYRIEEDKVLSRNNGPYGSGNADKKAEQMAEAPWLHYANAYNFHLRRIPDADRAEAEAQIEAMRARGSDPLTKTELEARRNTAIDQVGYRQIGLGWLDDAGELALRINSEVNNTSLVLLFELQNTGRTLLFTGDAQRGSWISWSNLSFGGVTAKELLGRCVFYKAGHHGSHNATLKVTVQNDYANLDWLGTGEFAQGFTAMVPSNKHWAAKKKPHPWKHPLPAIEEALKVKAKGRVMAASDLTLAESFRPEGAGDDYTGPAEDDPRRAGFDDLSARARYTRLYIELHVDDTSGEGPEKPRERPPFCRYPGS